MTYYITMLISPTGVDILVNWSSLSVNNNLLLCILQGKSETLRYIFWLLSSLVTYRVVSCDALAYTCIGRAYPTITTTTTTTCIMIIPNVRLSVF